MRTLSAVSILSVTFLALILAEASSAAPNSSWDPQAVSLDCSGSGDQGGAGCHAYDEDIYENLDYSSPNEAATADIQLLRAGSDGDYLLIRIVHVADWNPTYSTHTQHIEIDVDHNEGGEINRGDFFFSVQQSAAFNTATWVDASIAALGPGYGFYEDANNDVGDANPLQSDFGSATSDGYETTLSQGSDQVWARVSNGHFEIAVSMTAIGVTSGDKPVLRLWSMQNSTLDKSKLYFHDLDDGASIPNFDNSHPVGSGNWLSPLAANATVPAISDLGLLILAAALLITGGAAAAPRLRRREQG